MANSRRKGSKNERNISKLLESWTKKKFSRTPSSGGLNWKNSQVSGDIVCTTEGHYFPFSIEAKNYREINFEHLLYLDDPDILKFWNQCVSDSKKSAKTKIPLLFMRYNGMPKDLHFVAIPNHYFILLKPLIPEGSRHLVSSEGFTIFRSTSLFKSDYKEVKKTLKIYLNVKNA